MSKTEKIWYAIQKEMRRFSLVELLENYEITIDEWDEFTEKIEKLIKEEEN